MRWLLACVLAVSTSTVQADGPLYAEVQLAAAGVNHSNLDFYPTFGSISAGLFVREGIGIEVFADSGITSDKKNGFDLEVTEAYGIGLRLQSAPVNRIQGYMVLGAVNFTVNQEANATASLGGSLINGDFTGVRVSLGIMERLERWKNVLVSLEYRHYNADQPIHVDAVLLGLRVNTP